MVACRDSHFFRLVDSGCSFAGVFFFARGPIEC